jgi:hypothetical protein
MKIICITELLEDFTYGKEYEILSLEEYKVEIPEECILLFNDAAELAASYPWFFKTPEEFAMLPKEYFQALDEMVLKRNE